MPARSRLIILGLIPLLWMGIVGWHIRLSRAAVTDTAGETIYAARVIGLEADGIRVAWRDREGRARQTTAGYVAMPGRPDILPVGQRVFLRRAEGAADQPATIVGLIREHHLLLLTGIFLTLLILIGGRQAPGVFLGLLVALGGTLGVLMPLMAAGIPPLTATIGCAAVFAILMGWSISGFHRRTLALLAGAACGLVLTAALSWWVTRWIPMTGVDSTFTQDLWHATQATGGFDFMALLRAGILFGALGVILDLATGVAAAVFEVADVNPRLPRSRLALAGLRVGRDVMSTEINTLVFAYAGPQIGLLLLPFYGPRGYEIPLLQVLSLHELATEAAYVAVGTAGLILTIPCTALASAFLARRRPCPPGDRESPRRRRPAYNGVWLAAMALWTLAALLVNHAVTGFWHRYRIEAPADTAPHLVRALVLSATPPSSAFTGPQTAERVQMVEVRLLSGPHTGRILTVHNPISGYPGNDRPADPGRRLLLKTMADDTTFFGAILDYDRGFFLVGLAWGLGILVMLVGGIQGVKALAALLACAPILVLGIYLVAAFRWPALPILTTMALIICGAVFLILAGPTRKALAAAGGAFGGVAAGGLAAAIVVRATALSGLQSSSLFAIRVFGGHAGDLDFPGLLAAGMLLGIVGVAMDVAIAVASAADEIADAGQVTPLELWQRGMNVGRKIMGTMVLALLFAYLGASLPLLLLPHFVPGIDLRLTLNSELFAAEIVRIVSGAIGITVAIPASALLATVLRRGLVGDGPSKPTRLTKPCVLLLALSAACLGAAPGTAHAAQPESAAARLDPRNVHIEIDADGLTGRFNYALVVGTFFEWNTDPTAIPGLFSEVQQRTRIRPRIDFHPVSLSSRDLYGNPFLIMTGNRFFRLTPAEIANLRDYLLAGGAVYADDCGGADASFRYMIEQLFPAKTLRPVPPEHPLYSSHYKLTSVPKILDLYGGAALGLGLFIGDRLAVYYTYDTDIPCGWEKNPDGSFVHLLPARKHEASIRLGVNIVTYFISQHPAVRAVTAIEEPNHED